MPDVMQFGVYHCGQCGDVELDEGGAYVAGRFYEVEVAADEGPPDEAAGPYSTWEDVLAAEEPPPWEDL
jgi:hypothetical protein